MQSGNPSQLALKDTTSGEIKIFTNFVSRSRQHEQPMILELLTTLFAYKHREEKSFDKDELIEGRLAAALFLFDVFLKSCKDGKRPDFSSEWLAALDDLSIAKCIEMRAYHRWISKNRPFQPDWGERLRDYMAAWEDVIAPPICSTEAKDEMIGIIKAFYGTRQEEMKQKKALWRAMAKPEATPYTHYCESACYVESFYRILTDERHPSIVLLDFAEENASMMSVLEFLLLAFHQSAGCSGIHSSR